MRDSSKKASYVDFQQAARMFQVGEVVYPLYGNDSLSGRVIAVFPAIGMVDVQFTHGTKRYPVEDLQVINEFGVPLPPPVEMDSVPGGRETVINKRAMARKLVARFEKEGLYWAQKDRVYRAKKSEIEADCYFCPRHPDVELIPSVYKRREGKSERLLGCPECMFLIKVEDIRIPEP